MGGGTSGFIVSSIFAKYRETSGLDFDIKLIHSDKIGSIGVGESSIFNINDLFYYLGLDDSDWMKECNATYKSSIRFENFYKQGRYFYYPFGGIDQFSPLQYWFVNKELYPEVFTTERLSLYLNPISILNEKNKLTDKDDYLKNNAAYHFDSHLLGEFLKKYSEKRGVEVIDDTYYGTEQDKHGNIESIVCDNGTYHADFFVDCSGFNSLLLGQKEDYISFGDTLINNKALVAKVPYTNKNEQLKNYTNCVALKNGWCWEIPLWDHMSYGYVHTNMFASEEEIEEEFFEYVGEVEYKTVNFKTGRYKNAWVNNVAAIGFSYGFIEPLESTGIATTLDNTFRLVESLSKRDMFYTKIDKDLFNYATANMIDRNRGFIEMHYYLSSREDSEYWKYVTGHVNYDGERYEKCLRQHSIERSLPELGDGGVYVVLGMNYSCYSKAYTVRQNEGIEQSKKEPLVFEKQLKEMEARVASYKSSYEYLKSTIYKRKFFGGFGSL